MACKGLIKIIDVNSTDELTRLTKVLTRLDARQWKNIKDNEEQLMNIISSQVYLPEEGKALTQEDKIHLKAVQQQIKLLANKFENIKGNDLNKLLEIFKLPAT